MSGVENNTETETVITETIVTETVTESDTAVAEIAETTTEAATASEEAKVETTTEDNLAEGEAATQTVTDSEAKAEEPAAEGEEVVVVEDIESGVLQKKGPKPFALWSDRWFYFSDDAFDLPKLRGVYKKHGPATIVPKGNNTDQYEIFQGIAHATHTGKGLLFYANNNKNTEPIGIIVLSQVTVEPVTGVKPPPHQFKLVTKHHTWELAAPTEKDLARWIQTIKKKIEEAKLFTVEETEEYRATFEKLVNRTAFSVSSPPLSPVPKAAKFEDVKPETAESGAEVTGGSTTVVTETTTDEVTDTAKTEEAATIPKVTKRRSIFGNPFSGRKRDTSTEPPVPTVEVKTDPTEVDAAVEASPEAADETAAESAEAKVEKAEEVKAEEVKAEEVKAEDIKTDSVDKRKSFFVWPKKVSFPNPLSSPPVPEVKEDAIVTVEAPIEPTETTEAATKGKEEAVVEATETTETPDATEAEVIKPTESGAPKSRKLLFTTKIFKKSDEKKPEDPKPEEAITEEAPTTTEPATEPVASEPAEPAATELTTEPTTAAAVEDKKEEKSSAKPASSSVTITRRITSMFKPRRGGGKAPESAVAIESTTEEAKAGEEVKEADVKEVKADDVEEATTDVIKVEETKTEDIKTEDIKTEDIKSEEIKTEL